ncbi:MAG TPA: hypothetical protein VMV04_22270 [Thermodesulfobacteriota bacterium]|nr:hypothetical protein [Thermodesulfobacteriota bacterium]
MPDLIRHPGGLEKNLDALAPLGSLRLPSVARLEFIPMKNRGRNDDLLVNRL